MLEAIKCNPFSYQFISEELKKDKDIIIASIDNEHEYSYVNFKFVNNELKSDKEFVLQVVKLNGFAVKFVSDELRRDKEVAMAAVTQNGLALQFL